MHELVHAYDFLVSGLKLTDCRPLAYRSVRLSLPSRSISTINLMLLLFLIPFDWINETYPPPKKASNNPCETLGTE